ncbi:2-C-methyl-D-erythritol 4-phosphate cytidylyltransferase [bacterium]|nr:2-C-methyl-D-erythritol 4-phosphate cytidylyltransferase [candidate division CSSED10-310 bacterium]
MLSWHLVVLAGGSGQRYLSSEPKQFDTICQQSILEISIRAFITVQGLASIVVVSHPSWITRTKQVCSILNVKTPSVEIVPGGPTRQESSFNGVQAIKGNSRDLVLIHDAARPLVTHELISRILTAASTVCAAIPIIPLKDSIIAFDQGMVIDYPERNCLAAVQTPQGFQIDCIRHAHQLAKSERFANAPDDGILVMRAGYPVATVQGDEINIKITSPEDKIFAESYLNKRKTVTSS